MATAVMAPKKEQAAKQDTGMVALEQKLARIDQIANECSLTMAPKSFGSALTVARAMQELRQLLTGEIMQNVMALQGTELGFVTDRDKPPKDRPQNWTPGYPEQVVRDVAIAAILRGFQMVNNEVNIIAGKFYAAKNGLMRVVRDLPGISELKVEEGRLQKFDRGALVPMSASWKLRGVSDSIKVEIPVKTDDYSTADQILGKALRKLLARIHARCTGTKQLLEEVEQEDAVEGQVVELAPIKPDAQTAPPGGEASPNSPNPPPSPTPIQDNPKSMAAQESVAQSGDRETVWMAYCKAIQEAESLAAVDMIYDTAFGPDRVVSWDPEDDQNAAKVRDGRKAALREAKSAK